MRITILVLLILLVFLSCKKNIEFQKTLSYNVEDFRKPGMDDYQTLRAVYDSVPNESQIIFGNGTYTFSHSISLYKTLHFFGNNTVLKREDQITYTLKEPTDRFSNLLILDKTEGIIPGDVLFIAFDQSAFTTTSTNSVSSISGDSIYMVYPIGNTINNIGNFPIGTKVFKSISFFGIADDILGIDDGVYCSFDNLIFDGNRDNNQGSYSWLYNSAVLAPIKGITYYRNCKFINSPAETIVGHNADIRNCTFYDLNGSAFHTTADKAAESEGQIHSYLFNNTFENTNQVPTEIGGHSEGAITHSNSGGYYTASNNTFLNVNGPVLGGLYPSVSKHDWGTSNITFTENKIDGATRIVRFISMQPGIIHDVKIEDNIITNMPSFSWAPELNYFPDIILVDTTQKDTKWVTSIQKNRVNPD